MQSESARRYLVVVRAGEKSLHRAWLGTERNWDLVVSWYADTPYEPVGGETAISVKGGLGDGLFKTFEALPHLLEEYDYFWLPDDDIEADCEGINRLFDETAARRLGLSQPALTHDSYFTYPHTLRCRSFLLRYTTIVEVMVPCLSRERLKAVLPMFADNPSLHGVDLVWARLEADNRNRAAIIDAVAVRHTRPVGVYLASKLKGGARDPNEARKRVLAEFGLSGGGKNFKCYAGIAADDATLRGALSTRWHMFVDCLRQFGTWKQRGAFWRILKTYRRPTAEPTRLAPIPPRTANP